MISISYIRSTPSYSFIILLLIFLFSGISRVRGVHGRGGGHSGQRPELRGAGQQQRGGVAAPERTHLRHPEEIPDTDISRAKPSRGYMNTCIVYIVYYIS